MNLNQLFWKLTKEKFTLHEVNFAAAAKVSTKNKKNGSLNV